MVIEKITNAGAYTRNFKCEYCSNKVRTDDLGSFGMLSTLSMMKFEVLCPVCKNPNYIPYYEQDDPKIDGEEYINCEDYMNKSKEGGH